MLRGTRKPLLVAPRNGAVLPAMREMAALCGRSGQPHDLRDAVPAADARRGRSRARSSAAPNWASHLIYAPAPATGGTGPASLAAVITVGNAEVLSGLVVHQAVSPGAPFVYGAGCGVLNLRTALDVLRRPRALPRAIRLPASWLASTACRRSPTPQCPTRSASTSSSAPSTRFTCPARRPFGCHAAARRRLHGVGAAQLIRDHHPRQRAGRLCARSSMRDCRVDAESLALAEILEVGPGGNHLARPLTRAAHRGYWQPALMDHSTHDRWQRWRRAHARGTHGACGVMSCWPRSARSG